MKTTTIKNYQKKVITLSVFYFLSCALFAQSVVQGKITNTEGSALLGATVLIEGTSTGESADLEGDFSLNVQPGTYTLVVRYIGFKSQTRDITIGDGETQTQNFQLVEGTALSEVVVIGSRNQNRTALETAVPVDIISVTEIVEDAPQVEVSQILN